MTQKKKKGKTLFLEVMGQEEEKNGMHVLDTKQKPMALIMYTHSRANSNTGKHVS